jgi:nucleoside-diphosphate-sugar epimerase
MKILVAGAGGYIGIPLCEELSIQGNDVIGIDRFFFEKKPYCEIIVADIRTFSRTNLSGIDCVIDLSGLSNDASADIDTSLTRSINFDGAINLATLAKQAGVKRYIYSSSASVYGDGSGLQNLKETDPINPLTLYAQCKADVEQELLKLNGDGFEVVILRNSTIFGVAPRMRFDLAVNIMTARAWKEHVIYVMGGGEQWRPFVHISDVVSAFMFMLTNGGDGEVYNVGGENTTIKQLSGLIHSLIPDAKIHNIPDNTDQRSYSVCFDKIHALGWHTNRNIMDGIGEICQALGSGKIDLSDPTCYTLQWYKSLLEWEQRIKNLQINGKIL